MEPEIESCFRFPLNFKYRVMEFIMINLKQHTLKLVMFFITTFLPMVIHAGDINDGVNEGYQQPSTSLITDAELYEQIASPLTGDFIPVNEFFLWGMESSVINITDVVGDLQNIGGLLQDIKSESFIDYQEYFSK